MGWTQTDLDAIENAIKSGTLRVKYSDKEVTYRSLDELLKIRDLIKKDLGLSSGVGNRLYASYSKGLKNNEE